MKLSSQDEESDFEKDEGKPNIFMRVILSHYGEAKYEKSEGQLAWEEYLIPGLILFNRWYLIPAAVGIQFCCGSVYAWSVFNHPIDKLIYGSVVNMAPITFYICFGMFGVSAAIMGPWLERNGPLLTAMIGAASFAIGHYISALGLYLRLIWVVFLGYGLFTGFGMGMCYISPVSAIQKWFPDKRGMASGMAVCGFGAGAIVVAKVQIPLYSSVGLPLTFVILGSCYLFLMSISALVLRTPPPNFTVMESKGGSSGCCGLGLSGKETQVAKESDEKKEEEYGTLIEALTSTNYRLMYLMLIANSIFGLVVNSRLSNMIQDMFRMSEDDASTIVSINGVFNMGGRLLFSLLSDYIGRKNCFLIMLTTQLVLIGCFSVITTSGAYWIFVISIWIITMCYGAGFGVIPALLSDTFGPQNIGPCHGLIIGAWTLGGVGGGLIFTAIFNSIKATNNLDSSDPYPYNVNVWWIFGVVCIGWTALLFVVPTKRDRAFTRLPKATFHRLLNKLRCRDGAFKPK